MVAAQHVGKLGDRSNSEKADHCSGELEDERMYLYTPESCIYLRYSVFVGLHCFNLGDLLLYVIKTMIVVCMHSHAGVSFLLKMLSTS